MDVTFTLTLAFLAVASLWLALELRVPRD